jgi:hypothetical protein
MWWREAVKYPERIWGGGGGNKLEGIEGKSAVEGKQSRLLQGSRKGTRGELTGGKPEAVRTPERLEEETRGNML